MVSNPPVQHPVFAWQLPRYKSEMHCNLENHHKLMQPDDGRVLTECMHNPTYTVEVNKRMSSI